MESKRPIQTAAQSIALSAFGFNAAYGSSGSVTVFDCFIYYYYY